MFKSQKNKNQEGQALVSGLILLIFTLFFSIYFLFISESYSRNYSNIQKARESTLRESSKIANLINQITINNQLILQSISVAEDAYAEAAEIGLYVSFNQPYWESYGILNQKNFSLNHFLLSDKTKNSLNLIYSSLLNKSARGLFLAKSLSEKNKKIIEKIPNHISMHFIRSSNADVFCFSLESRNKYYQKPGFHNIPIYENLYHFYLEKKGCKLTQSRGLYGFFNSQLPLIFSNESDDILSYKSFNSILKNDFYGIWYVDPNKYKEFFNSLYFNSRSFVEENSKFTVISKNLSKITFFQDIKLNQKEIISGFSKIINARITHPYFYCQPNKNQFGDFIFEEDFLNIDQCALDKNYFIKSFFYPNWISLITKEVDKK